MNRFSAWAITRYATQKTNGNPNPPTLTVAQALAAWADSIMAHTKADVVSRETQVAVAAVVPPPPFVAT